MSFQRHPPRPAWLAVAIAAAAAAWFACGRLRGDEPPGGDPGAAHGGFVTAKDREFWSFRPIEKPRVPSVDGIWARTSVDAFIQAAREQAGLPPAPPAERRTLIRRLTFDLTGLPPTPDEVKNFVEDPAPDAWERVVDRLLSSTAYGERMARWWLDIARYGEDQAHTFQARKYPQGFRYRDWLIDAFTRDLPYDEFIRQQIAADLIDGPDKLERLPALGLFACGPVYYGDKNQMDQVADRIDTLTRGFLGLTAACARCHDHKYDPIPTIDYYSLASVFASTEYDEVPLVSEEEAAAAQSTLSEQEKKEKNPPKRYPYVHALKDAAEPKTLRVHLRGNAENLGEEAPRRFLELFEPDRTRAVWKSGSGRRELAEAIASPRNPLTARVAVNRLWQMHFGKGIVRTASNFGILGERPTHPELLDHLATRLIESGWSLKAIHREIVLSATYRQSCEAEDAVVSADPENRLWTRFPRRRLEAEPYRDALLAVTGELDSAVGGPSLGLDDPQNLRRTLYGQVSRHELHPFLRLFDFPDPNVTSDQRSVTTGPLQQLFALNSEFMVRRARSLAERLAREAEDDARRIERAYELLFARPPTAAEAALGIAYLSAEEDPGEPPAGGEGMSRWARYLQALLASNEFLYVD